LALHTPPWTPLAPVNTTFPHICKQVAEIRKARSRWQRSRNQDDRAIYNRLKPNLQTALKEARNATFEQFITSVSPDDTSLWKAAKSFKRPQVSIPRSGNGMTVGQRVIPRRLRLSGIIFARYLRRTRPSILMTSWFLLGPCPFHYPLLPRGSVGGDCAPKCAQGARL